MPRATVTNGSPIDDDRLELDRLISQARTQQQQQPVIASKSEAVSIKGTVLSALYLPRGAGERGAEAEAEEQSADDGRTVETRAEERSALETRAEEEGAPEVESPTVMEEDPLENAVLKIPLVRDGVGATLALLQLTGNPFEIRAAGERMALRPVRDINLSYRDEAGQELDAKGAYKQLSRRFHGKEMGVGRREKEDRRKEAAKRTSQSQLAQRAKEMQRALGVPHLVLDQKEEAPVQAEVKPAVPAKRPRVFGLKM